MFEIPGTCIKKVNITEDAIMGSKKPEYTESQEKDKSYQEEQEEKKGRSIFSSL